MKVQDYIDSINNPDNNDEIREIRLNGQRLKNADIVPLMEALAGNPDVAQQIRRLDFSNNQLTSINPQGLEGLRENVRLDLRNNQLTTLAHIMLFRFGELNQGFRYCADAGKYTRERHPQEVITREIIEEHFRALLRNLQDYNNRCQPTRIMLKYSASTKKLPNELIRKVFDVLNENQSEQVESPSSMAMAVKLEIDTLKWLFPGVMEDEKFVVSAEFIEMQDYCARSLPKLKLMLGSKLIN